MTLLWQISLGLEVALLIVFALIVGVSLLTRGRMGSGGAVKTYPHRPAHDTRSRRAA